MLVTSEQRALYQSIVPVRRWGGFQIALECDPALRNSHARRLAYAHKLEASWRAGAQARRHAKPHEQFLDEARAEHGEFYDYSRVRYTNSATKIVLGCPKHGDFRIAPNNHLRGSGCPRCRASSGERAVRLSLQARDIEFIEQWAAPGCRDRRQLRFDFFVPTHNLAIEFDGAFHRQPVVFSGDLERAQTQFDRVVRRDAIKTRWCADHDVRLVRLTNADDIEPLLGEVLAQPAPSV